MPGRSKAELRSFLESLKGRDKVKVICIDLSSNYRNIIRKYFPNAKIVADRFHVIRLINHHSMNVYQTIDPNIKYQRGLLNMLRTHPNKLSPKQLQLRQNYFDAQPAIEAVYNFKQRLHHLLMYKHRSARQCRRLIPIFLKMINVLKQSGFTPMQTLGKTLCQWRDEIARMWRFTKNNGITEGFHRKMKLIQRRAYGFRCFENYRLRVRVLCAGITAP